MHTGKIITVKEEDLLFYFWFKISNGVITLIKRFFKESIEFVYTNYVTGHVHQRNSNPEQLPGQINIIDRNERQLRG